jgi:hypothetical protein
MDNGCSPITMTCRFCNGTGSAEAAVSERWHKGEALRKERVRRGYSQREQASILGISQLLLNDIEHRRADAPVYAKCDGGRPTGAPLDEVVGGVVFGSV